MSQMQKRKSRKSVNSPEGNVCVRAPKTLLSLYVCLPAMPCPPPDYLSWFWVCLGPSQQVASSMPGLRYPQELSSQQEVCSEGSRAIALKPASVTSVAGSSNCTVGGHSPEYKNAENLDLCKVLS